MLPLMQSLAAAQILLPH